MKENGVGVIVGRFQVAELTDGHKEIFEYVLSKGHNQNIVILGVAPTKATKNNPLDFDSRRRMIEETYPGMFTVMFVKDNVSDEVWSNNIDALVDDIAGRRPVTFYGSRDSFIIYYHGKHKCEEYQQRLYCSGTVERDSDGKIVRSSKEWRAGCIYATQNRYPTVYPTVDVAIFDGEPGNPYKYIYLCRKANEKGLRFIGGFADVTDEHEKGAKLSHEKETFNKISRLLTNEIMAIANDPNQKGREYNRERGRDKFLELMCFILDEFAKYSQADEIFRGTDKIHYMVYVKNIGNVMDFLESNHKVEFPRILERYRNKVRNYKH